MKRLPAKQRRAAFRAMIEESLDDHFNLPRRFKNAIRALAMCDPNWNDWVRQNLPKKLDRIGQRKLRPMIQLVETRARFIILKPYAFHFGSRFVDYCIKDWPFNNNGRLTPG